MQDSEAKPSGQPACPLRGVRVVALGGGVACAFAERWLAALGAEVVRAAPDAPEQRALLAGADVVLDAADTSLPVEIPVVRITPFGLDGPYVGMPHTPFTLAALSGLMWHVGDADRPPLVQWGDQVAHLVGLHAFAAALAVIWARGGSLELAAFEVAAALVGHHTSRYSQVPADLPRQPARALWRLYPTADGWAGISCTPRDRAHVAEVMGLPEIATALPFMARSDRDEAILVPLLEAWFGARTCDEVDAIGGERNAPLAAVRSIAQVAASPQLAHREFFGRASNGALTPGRLWRSNAHDWEKGDRPLFSPSSVPSLGGRRRKGSVPFFSARPLLEGVRVLDLGQVWAGPYAAMLLADQGADVIKIESPSRWDPNRVVAPPGPGREKEWWNTCAYFQEYNRNKRSLALELAHPRGRDVLAALVRRADVVIENYRAGVLDRLGIGYDWLRAQRSDVILVSMAAFGQSGPDCARPGYGPVMEELSGLASLTGWGDGRPQLAIGYAYGDPVAATAAAAASLAALIHRRRTGCGQHVDLAQFDVLVAMIGEAFTEWSTTGREPAQQGNRRPGCAPHGAYPCSGIDEWVAIAVESDAQWRGLRRAMGDPEWMRDPQLDAARSRCAREDELDLRISDWTRSHQKTEIFARCTREGVPAAPVHRTSGDLLENEQLRARGFYERVVHPAGGEWLVHGWEWRPASAGRCVRSLASDFGADNAAVLREAGLSDDEIAALATEGVIGTIPIGVPALPER
jgi:crotonobetainyl-CoA:carnitine CoA-transferase CaiB-like acyl-CoA transferase